MNGWFVFSICLVIISCISISKLVIVYWDIKKMTTQLKNVNEHFGSNELVRTNSHNKNLLLFTQEINQLIHLYKENERHLEKRERQLKEEITNISHDLRTPLTSMKGFSQLLADEKINATERRQYLDIIQGKIDVLTSQVDLFYELSSIDSLDHKLQMKQVALHELIQEKSLLFYEEFQQKQLQVHLDEIEEVYVLANEKALERIVVNIIQNALRYAKSYFTWVLIEEDKYVRLQAINDTTELSEEDVTSIFNRSYRKDQSRGNGQLGLGLHIVQQLLHKQGGEVAANIEDGIFTLELLFYKR